MPSTEKAQQTNGTSDVKNGSAPLPLPTTATKPRSLAHKMVEIMACVDRVAKNGNNASQGYKFAQATDVYDAVRSELAQRFVLMLPSVEKSEFFEAPTKSGGVMRFCTLHVRFDFTDAETGEISSARIVGSGSDSGDKAPYKAMTGATKACLINTFLIPTGDDPEHEPKQSKAPPPAGAEALKQRMRSAPPSPPQPQGGAVFPNYGALKGQPVYGAALKDLDYYASGARKTLADPAKSNFHNKERALLAAIDAEIMRQRTSMPDDNEPPPPGDEDAPY